MTPRFPDCNVASLEQVVRRAGDHLRLYPDLDDPRYHTTFMSRAQARWALGAPARLVLDDLRSAALCLRGQARVRLYKLEVHRLKSRRLDPLHLALLHPDPDLVEKAGAEWGLPLATWYANAGTADLEREVRVMSPYFVARTVQTPADVVGYAAATYAAALGYLMAGDNGSARAVLRVLAREVDDLTEAPPAAGRRYLLQCAALTHVLERRESELAETLAALVPFALAERTRALERSRAAVLSEGEGAPDLVIPALMGLAMLLNLEPSLAAVRAADADLAALCRSVASGWEQVE